MQSVNQWATSNGWDYAFMDDAFLALAPASVQKVCGSNIYALTDICRLEWMRGALDRGYDRAIWADADVLVFAPQSLQIDEVRGHGFAREVFLQLERSGGVTPIEGINNALMFFESGDDTLEVYLQACLDALQSMEPGKVPRTALGPHLLKSLDDKRGLNRIERVGLFTQAVMSEIVRGRSSMMNKIVELHGMPLSAANLCHFLRNATPAHLRAEFDSLYLDGIRRLLASK